MSSDVKIAVVGAGLMGHGIAQVFATAGAAVIVYDSEPRVRDSVRERIATNLEGLGEDQSVVESIAVTGSLEDAVSDADWVFEAAPEKLELKQQLFARMDRAAPATAVLATNTSVIRVSEIAQHAHRRGRIIGTHWWNPPWLVPLVEVVQGEETEPRTVRRTLELLEDVGKTPVHVRLDVAGFVGNRLQHSMWREAFALIDAGVCDAETIDTVVKQGFGRRLAVLGPVENADMVGLDLILDIHEYVLPRLDPPSEPSAGLRERVARRELGMKTGTGYRTWTPDQAEAARQGLRARLETVAGE